jgi:ATP synthase F1 complex assembly factor 1
MMSQEDAQLLVIALQRFYLWTESKESGKDGMELLMAFHEKPQEFEWKDLLRFSTPTA